MIIDDITATYNAKWFETHDDHRPEYRALAECVADTFGTIDDVLDIGCGRGYVIERLRELGYMVDGIDGSRDAGWPETIRRHCSVADIGTYEAEHARDLVICTEVAEHLPASMADGLVYVLSKSAREWIYFTAAPPGQGGYEHINEQPWSYWSSKFEAHGWAEDVDRTARIRTLICERIVNMPWFRTSSVVLRRMR